MERVIVCELDTAAIARAFGAIYGAVMRAADNAERAAALAEAALDAVIPIAAVADEFLSGDS